MKSKMKLSLVAAIVAIIALSGFALAVGINLFEYFGKNEERLARLAPNTELATAKPESVESEALGTTKAAFNSAYYDGQSLIAGFTLENSKRYEAFEPTPEMLAKMEKVDSNYFTVPYDEGTPGIEFYNAYQTAVYEGRPAGVAYYSIYPSDHCSTGDGIDLPPSSEQQEVLPDGSMMYLREFESPLPEEAQNRDSLELHIKLWQMPSYYYFDGADHYELYETQQSAGEITAVVQRTDAVTKTFAGDGEYNGAVIAAEVQVSAVRATLNISAKEAVFGDPGDDSWYDALLVDESGTVLRTEEVNFSGDHAAVSFQGSGKLSEQLTLYIGIDQEGEWSREDFIANAVKINLNAVED
ncbi:MAG: hypothetical protein IJ466_10930 [Clostridia bacterium]|nr:hypothetical protein [Clostridia bacterium]